MPLDPFNITSTDRTPTMKCFSLLAVLLVTVATADVQVLNDKNFERITQATTGSTTGSWFIKFYAPWCGHCKNVEPHFIETSNKMSADLAEGGNNILLAEVDCTNANSKKTCKRLGVASYPTILLLMQGKMVEYAQKRDAEHMTQFLQQKSDTQTLEDFVDDKDTIKDIPGVPTALGELMKTLKSDLKEMYKYKKNILLATVAFGFVLGWMTKGLMTSVGGKDKEE